MRFAEVLPGWVTVNKVLLCMQLAGMIYDETILPPGFTHYYSNTGGGKNQRLFLISHDSDLFLVIRGADSTIDYTIASDFRQIPFQNGLAHAGLVNASKFVLNKTIDIIRHWKGHTFIVGHSTGGGTAGIVAATVIGDYGLDNVYGILIGPIPSVTMSVSKKYRKNILTLQNLNDVITFQTVLLMRKMTGNLLNRVNQGSVRGLRNRIKKLVGMVGNRMENVNPMYIKGMKIFLPKLLEHVENSFNIRYKQLYHMGSVVAFKSGEKPKLITRKNETHRLPPVTETTLALHSVESYMDAVTQAVVDDFLESEE